MSVNSQVNSPSASWSYWSRSATPAQQVDMVPWYVHKFGGTSVGNADCYERLLPLLEDEVADEPGYCAVVVSAMRGVTDALLDLCSLAAKRLPYDHKMAELKNRVLGTAQTLLATDAQRLTSYKQDLDDDFQSLEVLLAACHMTRHSSDNTRDVVSGLGEVWSAKVLTAYMQTRGVKANYLDAIEVLVVEPTGPATVPIINWEESEKKLTTWLRQNHHDADYTIITGYRAMSIDGLQTTLKRNGSDFSGTIFGSILKAEYVTIWTDVDGIFTADPRIVPEAILLESMTFDEALEMAYFGANVLYPPTVMPAIRSNTPIFIRNTFNPRCPGTKIHSQNQARTEVQTLAGVTVAKDCTLIRIDGASIYVGPKDIFSRLFAGLRDKEIQVLMISQGSSHESISFAVRGYEQPRTLKLLQRLFYREIELREMDAIEMHENVALLTVVGEGISRKPGVTKLLFRALSEEDILVRAIAKGSSPITITAVIDSEKSRAAVQAVHHAFYRPRTLLVLGLIGVGRIGGHVLKELVRVFENLRNDGINLQLGAVADANRMLLVDPRAGTNISTLPQLLELSTTAFNISAFVAHLQAQPVPYTAIVDCTTSAEMGSLYLSWMNAGLMIISSNRTGLSGSVGYSSDVRRTQRTTKAKIFYNAACLPGLPLLATVNDMTLGAKITRIRGVFSPFVSHLFQNLFDGADMDEQWVVDTSRVESRDWKSEVNGLDTARKLVILAHEMKVPLELTEVTIDLEAVFHARTHSALAAELKEVKPSLAEKIAKAKEEGKQIRYVGLLDVAERKAQVGLEVIEPGDPLWSLPYSDCAVELTNDRCPRPVVLSGVGPTPEVVAEGLVTDLIRLAKWCVPRDSYIKIPGLKNKKKENRK